MKLNIYPNRPKYFNMEKVSFAGFCNFCRNNLPLMLTVSVTLFFTYGIRLFCYSVGIDTEFFMADRADKNRWLVSLGRFGQVLLSNTWRIREFNPFTGFFIAFCLIWVFTMSWSYIIAIFNGNTGRDNALIPFALVFMTVPIWAEQFFFTFQAAENAFIIALSPYVVYLMYKGFLDNEKGKIICATILLVFMTSVYQAIVPLFICGVFICFILLQEHSNYEPQVYRKLCLKLFVALVTAMVVYSMIDRVIIPAIFNIERAVYWDNMNRWGRQPISETILTILAFGYVIFIGHIPQIHEMVIPILATFASADMLERFTTHHASMIAARTFLLFPVAIFFLIKIVAFMRTKIPSGRKLLYTLAGIGVPLSIMLLTFIGGNMTPLRALYALPLAYAFMFFYSINQSINKTVAVVVTCFALFGAAYQAQLTAQLFYSDQVRHREDIRIAHELNDLIMQVQPDNEKLPVALIGGYRMAERFSTNFLQGQAIGLSFFEGGVGQDLFFPTVRALTFMRNLGMHFDIPNREQLIRAYLESEFMPSFPALDSVKRSYDVIVVKLSDDHWFIFQY